MKQNYGWSIALLITVMPIIIWLAVRWNTPMFTNYGVITHSLGQLTALVGMTLFCLSFILATRLNFLQKIFGGFDKMYKAHHLMGIIAFILILFHPILLVLKFIPSNFPLAAKYLLPSSTISVNYGIFALLGMILLIVLTMFIKMKYHNWKISHKFMAIVFVLAALHVFLVTTDISRYPVLKLYMGIVSLLGALSIVYTNFLKYLFVKKYEYKVSEISKKGSINLITLEALNKKIPFEAGQFAMLNFTSGEMDKEQHPYSIIYTPEENRMGFAIKCLGDYTCELHKIKVGDRAKLEGAYGGFSYKNSNDKKQIWIAGGIGITPFISLAKSLYYKNEKDYEIDLYYSIKTKDEAMFLEEFKELANKIKNSKFRLFLIITDERGYLKVEDIIKYSSSLENKTFLFCGPSKMTESLMNQLKDKGVEKDKIIWEDFNLK